jgi:hypothetical protein
MSGYLDPVIRGAVLKIKSYDSPAGSSKLKQNGITEYMRLFLYSMLFNDCFIFLNAEVDDDMRLAHASASHKYIKKPQKL